MSWPLVKLKDICRPRQWKTIAASQLLEDGYPVYGANGKIGFYSEYTHEFPTLMITCRGATCGNVHISEPKSYINGNAMALDELDFNRADLKYLYYFFLSRGFEDVISGSAQPQITGQGLTKVEIPLPPLPEQKRIAAILDKADAIRRKRQQAIQLADDFLRAVFLDMFGDPLTNPKGWETFALADVVRKDSIITYGIVQAGEHVDGGVPYIRTGDFKNGRLVRSGYACTSTDIASKFKRSEVAPGDIVYCIRASVGSADVVPEFLAGANLTQGTAKISLAHDMKAEFLVELLRSAGFRSWIDKNSKGATFKEITLARLREAPVFKPPMFEQEAFIRIKKIVMERLTRKFQEADVPLFESLSQKAFSGQL